MNDERCPGQFNEILRSKRGENLIKPSEKQGFKFAVLDITSRNKKQLVRLTLEENVLTKSEPFVMTMRSS